MQPSKESPGGGGQLISFYAVALIAAAGYLILHILVGLLRGRMHRQS